MPALTPGLTFPDGLLQNGADAAALYAGNAADFPPGTPVTTANLLDALVYDTGDADDPGLLVLLNPGQPQVDEAGRGNPAGQSSGRCPNGSGGARNTATYDTAAPSPGARQHLRRCFRPMRRPGNAHSHHPGQWRGQPASGQHGNRRGRRGW